VLRSLRDALEEEGAEAGAMPLVVFVTADGDRALEAFDAHAVDYVLKPIDPDRLHTAVARARVRHLQAAGARRFRELQRLLDPATAPVPAPRRPAPAAAEGGLDRLVVRSQEKLLFVRTAEIDWIEAAGNYARLRTAGGSHLIRDSLSRLETALDASRFARIHRSTIVNLDRVRQMEPWFSGEYLVILHDGTQLKLSRWYRDRVLGRLSRTPGELAEAREA
jgi:two-component system LytT family response regulator